MTDHLGFLFSFLGTASALVFWEFVKNVGIRLVHGYAPPSIAFAMQTLDRILPALVADGASTQDVEDALRARLGSLTGSEWKAVGTRFDLATFLERNKVLHYSQPQALEVKP